MEKDLGHLFREAKRTPAHNLSETIWARILVLEERKTRFQMWAYTLVGMFSFAALFPVVNDIALQFTRSGAYEYMSLAFSDTAMIGLYWKELLLSVVDSLPVTSIIITFALLFVFLVSIKRAARRLKTAPLALA